MSDETSVEEAIDPLSLFDERWREPVIGLVYLGKLSETVEFCGHTFGLRTLLPQDKLAIGMALQPYRNTLMEVEAFQYAHLGMALTSMDGDEDFCPAVGPDIDVFARGRLNWVGKNLYPPTIEFLWARYKLLEATAALGTRDLDSLLKGGQPPISPPWLDSLNAEGTSLAEIGSDSPPSTTSS